MAGRKKIRERGKIRLSEYFKELNVGDKVAIKREKGLVAGFPKRIQGRTGIVEGKRGSGYVVKLKELNMEKTFVLHPSHLKRLKTEGEK